MPKKENFERTLDGKKVDLFTLKNASGTTLCLTNYGCRIVSLLVQGSAGQPTDVVVGFDTLDGYLTATEVYHGATIGRYANRIAGGRFTLNGQAYTLATNNAPNHLHGGPEGFHTKVWEGVEHGDQFAALRYRSADGEEGYPGNLEVGVRFELTDQNEVHIAYEAHSDRDTVINLTNHAYFNLNGQGSGTILHHSLQLFADRYTPVNEYLIPTGELAPVEGTPFDFRTAQTIGLRINEDHEQLRFGNGYDHNYVLNGAGLRPIALVRGDKTGLQMEVLTDQPGVQFYTGNFMSGDNIIKGQVPDHFRTAFCLETQHFPDAPNQKHFPSATLKAGVPYTSRTVYSFPEIS